MKSIYFKHNNISHNVTMLYGFVNKKKSYDIVLTLLTKDSIITVYGFVSKVKMDSSDFKKIWYYITKNFYFKYLKFEVLVKHASVYRHYLPIINEEHSKTFNGYDSVILTADLNGELNGKNEKELKKINYYHR